MCRSDVTEVDVFGVLVKLSVRSFTALTGTQGVPVSKILVILEPYKTASLNEALIPIIN